MHLRLVKLVLLALPLNALAAQDPAAAMTIRAKPIRDGATEVSAVAVALEIQRWPAATKLSLRVPIVYTGRIGIADRVDSLVIRDRAGVVAFDIINDAPDPAGVHHFRHWRARRAVAGTVTVTYRMRPQTAFTGGPQFEHWATGGGISSGGMQLFLIPEGIDRLAMSLRWDLSDLAAGSIGTSTYGEGALSLVGKPDTLWEAFYLAGPAGRLIAPDSGFRAYWLGIPTYDPRREMEWTFRIYDYLRTFYRDSTTTSYRVFLRAPGGRGGTAQQNSFMGGATPGRGDSAVLGPRNTLAHEIGHMYVGGLQGGEIGGDPWFSEGLNTHYTRLLLLRSGLAPVSDYLDDINSNAARYFSSPYRNASAEDLRRIGFSTGFGASSAQNVAYTRGSLFWSDLDHRIRLASEGKRTLDDVMLPLFVARRRGVPLTRVSIIAALERELGPSVRAHFEAVIDRGETLDVASGAFGPCFEGRQVDILSPDVRATRGYQWIRVDSIPDAECRKR